MPTFLPRKKKPEELDLSRLSEPALTSGQRALFEEGIALFNEQRFWEAHEAWEGVWIEREEDSRIFFQGIIQAAAGYHLIVERPRVRGALKNLTKALTKLRLFPPTFLGISVSRLNASIEETVKILRDAERRGEVPEVRIPLLERQERS